MSKEIMTKMNEEVIEWLAEIEQSERLFNLKMLKTEIAIYGIEAVYQKWQQGYYTLINTKD